MEAIHPDRDHIAVYGSLMRIHGAQQLAGTTDKLRLIGPCKIPGLLYDLGEFPGLLPGNGEVVGELYELEHPDALRLLDDYEAFYPNNSRRSLFIRQRMRLAEPAIECWVYFYNQPLTGHTKVANGNWTDYLRRHNRPLQVNPLAASDAD